MPVPIRRDCGHAAHDYCGGHAQFAAGRNVVRFAHQEAPERYSRAQQRPGKEAAFEVPPGVQHILRTHARGAALHDVGLRGAMGRQQAVAVVQDLVAEGEGQFVLQALFLIAQPAVDHHRTGRFEARAQRGHARSCAHRRRTSESAGHGVCRCASRNRATRASRACRPARRRARCRGSRCAASPARRGSAVAQTAGRWCRSARVVPATRSAATHARTGTPARAASPRAHLARAVAARLRPPDSRRETSAPPCEIRWPASPTYSATACACRFRPC